MLGILVFGLTFGFVASFDGVKEFVPGLIVAYVFFQCGSFGKLMAINLIRDRQNKFRLTLQLIGVPQKLYILANLCFSLAWGLC